MFKRVWDGLLHSPRIVIIAVGVLIFGAVTLHHIGSSPSGYSPAEKRSLSNSVGLHKILNSPLNGPHDLVLYIAQKISPHRAGVLRLSSYIFGLLFFGCFYYLARAWFGKTIGLLSALILAMSPFFLIPSRLASAEIMFFWPTAIMAIYYWLGKTNNRSLVFLLLMFSAGLAIYTPGLVWWLIGGLILSRLKLKALISELPRPIIAAGILLFILIFLPAGLAIFKDWHFIEDIAALPHTWAGPLRIIKNLVWMGLSLGFRTPHHSPILIGRLPLLNLIQLGLLVFGVYALWTAARLKAIVFALNVALAIILAAINDDIDLLLIGLPAIGFFMAAGLRYLYIEWRSVFPLNPIPKSLALLLMTVLVVIQLVYGLSYSLVAWPHTPDTRSIYVLK